MPKLGTMHFLVIECRGGMYYEVEGACLCSGGMFSEVEGVYLVEWRAHVCFLVCWLVCLFNASFLHVFVTWFVFRFQHSFGVRKNECGTS